MASTRCSSATYATHCSNSPRRSRSLEGIDMNWRPKSFSPTHLTAARSTTIGDSCPGRCSRNGRCCPCLTANLPLILQPPRERSLVNPFTPFFPSTSTGKKWRAVSSDAAERRLIYETIEPGTRNQGPTVRAELCAKIVDELRDDRAPSTD